MKKAKSDTDISLNYGTNNLLLEIIASFLSWCIEKLLGISFLGLR